MGEFWQVHLKGKVVFSLAYGLHRFQIQFHLQIEIEISNFKLQFQFIDVHDIRYMNLKLNFNYKFVRTKITITNLSQL